MNLLDFWDPEEARHFQTFDQGLGHLSKTLPSFDDVSWMPIDYTRNMLVTFTLTHVAIIQLHASIDTSTSIRKCIAAVQAVVQATRRCTNLRDWHYVNPIMGVCFFLSITRQGSDAVQNVNVDFMGGRLSNTHPFDFCRNWYTNSVHSVGVLCVELRTRANDSGAALYAGNDGHF